MDGMDEFKEIFFTECSELLVDMEARVMTLEENVIDKEHLNAIFRCAHSIKGGAGAFGMDAIMNFTHALEALLDKMRDGILVPTRDSIDALLKSVDIVNQMLSIAQGGGQPDAQLGAAMLTRLQVLGQGGSSSAIHHAPAAAPVLLVMDQPKIAEAAETLNLTYHYTISFKPHEELFATGNEPLLILRELSRLGEVEIQTDISRVPQLDDLVSTQCYLGWTVDLHTAVNEEAVLEVFEFVTDISDVTVTKTESAKKITQAQPDIGHLEVVQPVVTSAHVANVDATPKKADGNAPASTTTSIRVDLEKVDRLVNMVGELVITEAMLRDQVRHLSSDQFSNLMRGIDELSHHTRELQEAVMSVRMQPVKSVFTRMPRIVRDTASQLGKDIQLLMTGDNTEVDKTVIEQLSDPLTHMIRNSCDHGIETPDQRAWNDKPLQGTIKLSAYQRSGRIFIEIADDGAGINRARVLAKAQEKGLVPAEAQLSDEEIDHLIFLPGFSTAKQVTSVSGRGVGMDVVRRNIESLGGNVRITNVPGKGSTFTVSLPLTLAILDGMIVRVGAENYIIPITSIIETMRPKEQEVHYVQGKGDVIEVRGDFVPLVYLHQVFNIVGAEQNPSNGLVVLVENGNTPMGIVVDELIGQQQVVIKSLEANADPVKGISGATILGDGKVSLILEINELKSLCGSRLRLVHAA